MRRTLTLLAVLTATHASAAQTTVHLQLGVTAVCELRSVTPTTVALRCTRDYQPGDLRSLPELAGQLPAGTWWLASSADAPDGGTLNIYALQPGSEAGGQIDYY